CAETLSPIAFPVSSPVSDAAALALARPFWKPSGTESSTSVEIFSARTFPASSPAAAAAGSSWSRRLLSMPLATGTTVTVTLPRLMPSLATSSLLRLGLAHTRVDQTSLLEREALAFLRAGDARARRGRRRQADIGATRRVEGVQDLPQRVEARGREHLILRPAALGRIHVLGRSLELGGRCGVAQRGHRGGLGRQVPVDHAEQPPGQ